jgi:hypothetical protein
VLRWADKDDVIASLDARITANWAEGDTQGTGHGYFTLIRGRVPTSGEMRDTPLMMHVTDRKGPKYAANVMVRSTRPVDLPGNEAAITIQTIEEVE